MVQTVDAQYVFDLRGSMPVYRAPHPSQFAPTVNSHLSVSMQARLTEAESTSKGRPNFVTLNRDKAVAKGGKPGTAGER